MKSKFRSVKGLRDFSRSQKIAVIILVIVVAFLATAFPMLISGTSLTRIQTLKDYKAGELSDETILSPMNFTYIDEVQTAKNKKEAENEVYPLFSYSTSDTILMRNRVSEFTQMFQNEIPVGYEFLAKYNLSDPNDVVERISELPYRDRRIVSRLINDIVVELLTRGLFSEDDVKNAQKNGWTVIEMEKPVDTDFITENYLTTIDEVISDNNIPNFVITWLSSIGEDYPTSITNLINEAVELLIYPNVSYDAMLRDTLIKVASDNVPPVLVEIKEGDSLLERDKIVTEQQLRTINEINKNAVYKINFAESIATFLILLSITVIFVYYFISSIPYSYRRGSYTLILLTFVLLFQVGEYFLSSALLKLGITFQDAFIPIYLIPLLISAITSKKFDGFVSGIFLAVLVSFWPTSKIVTFFYIFAATGAVILILKLRRKRLATIYEALFSAFAVMVITTFFGFVNSYTWTELLVSVVVSAINVLLSYLLMSILLPILEKVFNIPTQDRLHELGDETDSPVIIRLSQVAQGTYNHCKNVSDMAYKAAEAIGANAELARVGGLYHDLGKSEHPDFFIENQSGKNIHDDLNPTLSAGIIRSHVKVGVEKGKEAKLPQEVVDIISEHHGNDLIRYFYNEAVKNSKNGGKDVDEEQFRYSSGIPSTPESGIVMLADCTEAATRTLKNPNHQKYDKFISSIILDKINHNQLSNANLTIKDLETIKEAFILQLIGRDHSRIEYK